MEEKTKDKKRQEEGNSRQNKNHEGLERETEQMVLFIMKQDLTGFKSTQFLTDKEKKDIKITRVR